MEKTIAIDRLRDGYYLRWWYNGWHYWYFTSEGQAIDVEGEPYLTDVGEKLTLGDVNLTKEKLNAMRGLWRTTIVQMLTDDGWKACTIDDKEYDFGVADDPAAQIEFDLNIWAKVGTFTPLMPVNVIPPPPPSPFIMKVKTDNTGTSNDNQFTIPTGGSVYNYTVERCDGAGVVLETLTNQTGNLTLTWDVPGTYLVKIYGTFPHIFFGNGIDKSKLIGVVWGDTKWSSMESAFYGCNNLVEMTGVPDLSLVTDMINMFRSASAFNADIGSWNTAAVENMNAMFLSATAFNQNIGSWNTAAVTNMASMFRSASAFNQNIGSWNTAAVENMSYMFYSASDFNQDLSGWCVTLITTEPTGFDTGATAWVLENSRPVWGTCP